MLPETDLVFSNHNSVAVGIETHTVNIKLYETNIKIVIADDHPNSELIIQLVKDASKKDE